MLRGGSKTLIAFAVFVTCLAVYILVSSGHHYSIDGIVMFQYAKSLWFDHSLKLNPPIKWAGFDFVIPYWSIGLSLAYTPLVAILSKTVFESDLSIRRIPEPTAPNYSEQLLHDHLYQYCSLLNALNTALSAAILYLICIEFGFSNRRAAATALTFGLFSPATVYAKLDFAQPLASLCLLASVLFLLKARTSRVAGLVFTGISIGLTILARSEFMILTPIFALSVCLMPRGSSYPNANRSVDILKGLLAFGLPVGALLLVNQAITFLKFGSWLSGYPLAYYLIVEPKHWTTAFFANLISPGRGILLFCPISILSLAGMKKSVQINRWFAMTLTASVLEIFLFYPIWRAWDGGLSWGPRFLIPIVPYLCFFAYAALPRVRSGRHIFALAALLTFQILVTMQGALFNYLEFYGSLGLSSAQLDRQLYHFSIIMSPLFSGWRNLFHPSNYDIRWFSVGSGHRLETLIPSFALICLVGLSKGWLDFFRTSPTAEISRIYRNAATLDAAKSAGRQVRASEQGSTGSPYIDRDQLG